MGWGQERKGKEERVRGFEWAILTLRGMRKNKMGWKKMRGRKSAYVWFQKILVKKKFKYNLN